MIRSARPVVIIAAVLLGGGCISLGPGRQPAPPNAVELSFYMRDTSTLPHYYSVEGEHHPDLAGAVTQPARTIGCALVGRDWELIVTQTEEPPDPAADVVLRVTGEAFGDPDVLSLWLSVEPDGTAVTGEGVPEWWGERDIQRCP